MAGNIGVEYNTDTKEDPRIERELKYLGHSIERLESFVERLETRLYRVTLPSQPTPAPDLTMAGDMSSELASDISRAYGRVNDTADRLSSLLERLEL